MSNLYKETKRKIEEAVKKAVNEAFNPFVVINVFEKQYLFHIRLIREEKDKVFVFDSAVYDFCLCPDYAKKRGWEQLLPDINYDDLLLTYEEYQKNKEPNREDVLKKVVNYFGSMTGVSTDANFIETMTYKYAREKFPNKRVIFGDKTWKWKEIVLEATGRHQGIFVKKYEGETPKTSDLENSKLIFNVKDDFTKEENQKIFNEKLNVSTRFPTTFGLG